MQLEEIKTSRGLRAEDGTIAADKPLVEVRRWLGVEVGWPLVCWAGWALVYLEGRRAGRQVAAAPGVFRCEAAVLWGSPTHLRHLILLSRLPACLPAPQQVLREAKEAKETAFQEQWKQMKQGKNRPLDEEEMEFIDSVAEQEAAARRRQREEEAAELAAFHAAQQQHQGGGGGDAGTGGAAGATEQQPGANAAPAAGQASDALVAGAAAARSKALQAAKKQPVVAIKTLIRPVVRIKSQGDQAAAAGGSGGGPAPKRQRTEGEQQQQQQGSGSDSEGPGLAGLLGGYSSSSDSDS